MAPIRRVAESENLSEEPKILTAIESNTKNSLNNKEYIIEIVWKQVAILGSVHIGALYGAYLMVTAAKYQTVIAWYLLYVGSGMGITAGSHRLWSHRSYQANFALRAILCFFQTMAVEYDIYVWSREHRVHHKFSETDADPHNANRGFFFSHVGCYLCRKHPDVKEKGKSVDLSDVLADPIVRFQHKYYKFLILIAAVLVPMLIPYFLWSETLINSFFICVLFRYCYTLNCTWLVNSVAHLYGNRPYDKSINPRENVFVNYGSMGEGYHNYHHTFPWDYSASELDWKYNLNFTTLFIDFFAKIGWVWDRKRVTPEIVSIRVKRTGNEKMRTNMTNVGFFKLWANRLITIIFGMFSLWVPLLIRTLIML